MGKRALQDPEDILDVSDTGATGGATKQTGRIELNGASVQCNVTSGSYLLQASNDNMSWFDVGGGAITAAAMVTLDANYRYLRVFTTTAGDGEFILFAYELLY